MRPGHRGARQQQDGGVHQRQVPGIEGLDALGRPDTADRLGREQRGVEIGPEEGDEEHHLRGDEQHHAHAQPDLDHAGMGLVLYRLLDDVPPPAGHDAKHAEEAHQQDKPAHRVVVHEHDPADRHQQAGHGPQEGPRARVRRDDNRALWCGAACASLILHSSSRPMPHDPWQPPSSGVGRRPGDGAHPRPRQLPAQDRRDGPGRFLPFCRSPTAGLNHPQGGSGLRFGRPSASMVPGVTVAKSSSFRPVRSR